MPKMKLSSFLFVCNENNLDVDVYTDYTDELEICYCGNEEFGCLNYLSAQCPFGTHDECRGVRKDPHVSITFRLSALSAHWRS